MGKRIVHYARFYYPGAFAAITENIIVETADITKIKIPEKAYALKLFDKTFVDVDVNGKTITTSSQLSDGTRYFIGKFKSKEAISATDKALYDILESSNWLGIIRSRDGYVIFCRDEEMKNNIIDPSRINEEGFIDAPEHKTDGTNHTNDGEGKE